MFRKLAWANQPKVQCKIWNVLKRFSSLDWLCSAGPFGLSPDDCFPQTLIFPACHGWTLPLLDEISAGSSRNKSLPVETETAAWLLDVLMICEPPAGRRSCCFLRRGVGCFGWDSVICLQALGLGGAALSGISEQTTERRRRVTLCKHKIQVQTSEEKKRHRSDLQAHQR